MFLKTLFNIKYLFCLNFLSSAEQAVFIDRCQCSLKPTMSGIPQCSVYIKFSYNLFAVQIFEEPQVQSSFHLTKTERPTFCNIE